MRMDEVDEPMRDLRSMWPIVAITVAAWAMIIPLVGLFFGWWR